MSSHASICNEIKDFLDYFYSHDSDLMTPRMIYIYGKECIGKTTFVKKTLEELNYEMIYYNSIHLKSSNMYQLFSRNNMSNTCILSAFQKKPKKNVIVVDDIYNVDKTNITQLIKLMRPKRTKRQKNEPYSCIPIICINNVTVDKKINELKKIAKNIYLPPIDDAMEYTKSDIMYFDNAKDVVYHFLKQSMTIHKHNEWVQESDRTSVSLIFHENIIDYIGSNVDDYLKLLDTICLSDYIDRVMFQKQLWILNEIISLIKNVKNNQLFHDLQNDNKRECEVSKDVRFTKILTKYSNEYNNETFITGLCKRLKRDWKDVVALFSHVENGTITVEPEQWKELGITKLELDRAQRYVQSLGSSQHK
jgi:hypothetical protein